MTLLRITDQVSDFNKAMIELRRLEASMNVAEILSNNSHITFIPQGSGTGNLLNLRV